MSEASRHLYLHTLSLAPKERLRRTKKLPSPEPYLGAEGYGMLEHSVSARWAPDDTIVLLLYSITDVDDPRKDELGQFQVSICVMPCMLHAGTVHCHGSKYYSLRHTAAQQASRCNAEQRASGLLSINVMPH